MLNYLFTSESVSEGHPDKLADQISDAILDGFLAQDPRSRVACETMVKSNMVILAGEITTKARLNYEAIVREAIRDIGYTDPAESFNAEQLKSREAISGKPGFWQPAMQVNYPGVEVPFTRIVEIKHATGQQIAATSILREFPKDWTPDDEPFYPVPTPQARSAYQSYADLAAAEPSVSFIGRLATYRYYNMDQVTGMALAEADRLISRYGTR